MKLANRTTMLFLGLALLATIVFTFYSTWSWVSELIQNKDLALFAFSLAPLYLFLPILIFLSLLTLCALLAYFILGLKRENTKSTKKLIIFLIIILPLPMLLSLQDDFPINSFIVQCLMVYIGLTALAAYVAYRSLTRIDSIPSKK